MLPYVTKDNCKEIIKEEIQASGAVGGFMELFGTVPLEIEYDGGSSSEYHWVLAPGAEAPDFDAIIAKLEEGVCPVLKVVGNYNVSGEGAAAEAGTLSAFASLTGYEKAEVEGEGVVELMAFSSYPFASISAYRTEEGTDWEFDLNSGII